MPSSGPNDRSLHPQARLLNQKTIKILLAGHAPVDHVGGHAYIKKISGAQVAMIDAEAPLLEYRWQNPISITAKSLISNSIP